MGRQALTQLYGFPFPFAFSLSLSTGVSPCTLPAFVHFILTAESVSFLFSWPPRASTPPRPCPSAAQRALLTSGDPQSYNVR